MNKPVLRIMLSLSVALCLLATGCHSSRREAAVKTVEYDRPGLKGVEPSTGHHLVDEARKWLGTRYRYGGDSRKGTDCSGMTMQVYKKVTGIKLPRDSRSQQSFTKRIKRNDLTPGDLVFFASKAGGSRVGHVGIYIGGGEFIHASSSRGVIISSLDERYYTNHFHSAGRVPGIKEVKPKDKPTQLVVPERTEFPDITKPADTLEITLDRLIDISRPDTIAADSISEMVKNAF